MYFSGGYDSSVKARNRPCSTHKNAWPQAARQQGHNFLAMFFWGSSGNSGENREAFLLFSFSSFACPKEETRKRHPNQSWPCGLPLLLAEGGTRKNSGFALRQFPRLFPPPPARRGRTNGGGREFPLARRRAPERLPKRGFALFEALAEFAKPRQHRGAQGIPPAAGQETQGALSLVRFFGQAKK